MISPLNSWEMHPAGKAAHFMSFIAQTTAYFHFTTLSIFIPISAAPSALKCSHMACALVNIPILHAGPLPFISLCRKASETPLCLHWLLVPPMSQSLSCKPQLIYPQSPV